MKAVKKEYESDKFSHSDLKRRKCRLIVQIIRETMEEGICKTHTRLPENLIWDEWATIGRTSEQSTYREHVVPLAFLRNISIKMFEEGKSALEIEQFWVDHYAIAKITEAEAKLLNKTMGLKEGKPNGWKIGDGVLARLEKVGIKLMPATCAKKVA